MSEAIVCNSIDSLKITEKYFITTRDEERNDTSSLSPSPSPLSSPSSERKSSELICTRVRNTGGYVIEKVIWEDTKGKKLVYNWYTGFQLV